MIPKFKATIDCDERGTITIPVTKIDFQPSCAYVYDPDMDYTYQIDYKDLHQFTGMKTKEGEDIYEGDLLHHPVQGVRKVIYPMSDNYAGFGLISECGKKNTLQDSESLYTKMDTSISQDQKDFLSKMAAMRDLREKAKSLV